jgi:hypothetical protein
VVAAGAGLMQIQLGEGAMSGCARTVQRSMAVDIGCSGSVQRKKKSLREKLRKLEEEFGSVTRRSGKETAETGKEFELERVVSCGSRDHRWRTKLDFGSSESFDDLHGCTALGAVPEIARVRVVFIGLRFLCCA